MHNMCHKFFQTFTRNQYFDFFTRWKQSNLFRVNERDEVCKASKAEAEAWMSGKVAEIKDQQTFCVEDYIVKRWKKKICGGRGRRSGR